MSFRRILVVTSIAVGTVGAIVATCAYQVKSIDVASAFNEAPLR